MTFRIQWLVNMQPLDKWDVKHVIVMSGMFAETMEFNQPLGMWEIDNVRTTNSMFYDALALNQSLDSWDLNKVTDKTWMFHTSNKTAQVSHLYVDV